MRRWNDFDHADAGLKRNRRAAAQGGDALAHVFPHIAHSEEQGIPNDLKKAAEWARKGAEKGDAASQLLFGIRLATREGGPMDAKKAVERVRKSAAKGNPAAELTLGLSLARGRGVKKNRREAENGSGKPMRKTPPARRRRCANSGNSRRTPNDERKSARSPASGLHRRLAVAAPQRFLDSAPRS